MGHGPHSSKIVVLFYVLFVLCPVYCVCVCVCVCTVLLPPGGYPIAVNKYIISLKTMAKKVALCYDTCVSFLRNNFDLQDRNTRSRVDDLLFR